MTLWPRSPVLSALAALGLAPVPAQAQLDDGTVVSILRECRQIADTAARTACYDNIPLGRPAAPAAASERIPEAPAPRGFGAAQLPQPVPARAAEPERIDATVTAAAERQPGKYLLTLEDGAQWQFVDSVPSSYDPPHRGSSVEIAGAALGSYLMTYRDQRPVRIRRVR